MGGPPTQAATFRGVNIEAQRRANAEAPRIPELGRRVRGLFRPYRGRLAVTALLGLDAEGWRGISGLHNVHWSHLHRSAPTARPAWRLVAHNVGAGFPLDEWNAGPDWNLEPVSA